MIQNIKLLTLLIIGIALLSGCSSNSDIKDNFCGIHIDYRYCKCAFHDEHCSAISMNPKEAKELVYDKYDIWRGVSDEEEKYGVIEKDGKLYLKSKPGEVLSIKTADLPNWAREQMVTVGAIIVDVGGVDTVTLGDSNVLLNGLPVARVEDTTAHGGVITEGSPKIFVNGVPAAFIGAFVACPMVAPGPVPHIGGPILRNNN